MTNSPNSVILCLLCLLLPVSCVENDRTLGDGLLPEESILHLGIKTFDLPITNRTSDSVQAVNGLRLLVGTMTDPVFGTVTSSGATHIVPYSDSTDFGANPELISAYLTLSIDSTYYLDNDQKGIHQRIKIYRLLTDLDSTRTGFCNSLTAENHSLEPVTVSDPVIYGTGEIRIELRKDFAQELLDTTPEEFEDFSLFIDRIPGLYIQAEPSLGTSGGRMNYISIGNSTINLKYTLNDPEKGISGLDTTESFAFGYYNYPVYNFFSTGSASLASDSPGDYLYLEGLSGIKPHIAASDLKSMLDRWLLEEGLEDQTVIISRAELIFPYEMPQDYERFNTEHPEYIYAFTNTPWATDTLRYYKPLPEIYDISNIGSIDRSHQQYSMDITSYIQQLTGTPSQDITAAQDLWIAPMKYRVNLLDERIYDLDNYNYNKIILNGPAAERRPTMTITYGVLQ